MKTNEKPVYCIPKISRLDECGAVVGLDCTAYGSGASDYCYDGNSAEDYCWSNGNNAITGGCYSSGNSPATVVEDSIG